MEQNAELPTDVRVYRPKTKRQLPDYEIRPACAALANINI